YWPGSPARQSGYKWITEHSGASTAWVAVRRDDLRIIGARDIGGLRYKIEQAEREDAGGIYELVEARHARPGPLTKTPAGKARKHKPARCARGEWAFAGSDAKGGASKWRCPTGECEPAAPATRPRCASSPTGSSASSTAA